MNTNLYEIVTEDPKRGLHMRDGLPYRGLKLARKERDRLIRRGIPAKILPYRPINERNALKQAVA